MSRRKRVVRNTIILLILFAFRFGSGSLYLTPIAAHEASERSLHYGPSEVVHMEDFDGGKFILGKYDKWISCNTVNKSMFFFWLYGGQNLGTEIDISEPMNYTWSYSRPIFKCYGNINDDRISRVDLTIKDGTVLSTTEFYDDMFLITSEETTNFRSIKAYDDQGNVLFEDDRYENR